MALLDYNLCVRYEKKTLVQLRGNEQRHRSYSAQKETEGDPVDDSRVSFVVLVRSTACVILTEITSNGDLGEYEVSSEEAHLSSQNAFDGQSYNPRK